MDKFQQVIFLVISGMKKFNIENKIGIPREHGKVLVFTNKIESMTQKKLCKATGKDKGQIARIIKEQIEKENIVKKSNDLDASSPIFELTEQGKEKVSIIEKYYKLSVNEMFIGFSAEELDSLDYMLNKIIKNLENKNGGENNCADN